MAQLALSKKVKRLTLHRPEGFAGKHSFAFFNIAQFFSALNDNLFKFFTIYLLIDLQGRAASNDILFWVGVSYVLPFLLFSPVAGTLADRFSKQKMIVLLKFLEILIIGIGCWVFATKWVFGCYGAVFLLSIHSALLGPPKYSIIPEIVRKDLIPKANGLVTAFTYLAMIVGTFLASFITHTTGGNFKIAIATCMVSAILGFAASLYIPVTPARRNMQKYNPLFFVQVYKTLKQCRRTPRLVLAILGSAFFLFLGAFLQLNMIPLAINALGTSEVVGGYLFLGTAIGIVIGAACAGRACRKEVDLGLPCTAILLLGITLCLVPFVVPSLPLTAVVISLLGLFGGLYVVPLDSYIQAFSASENRGQVIASLNFLSFFGVLLAPISLFLLGKVCCLSATSAFVAIACVVFLVFAVQVRYLSGSFFNFLSRRLIHPFYQIHIQGNYPFGPLYQEEKSAIFASALPKRSLMLLLGEYSKIHLFFVKKARAWYDRPLSWLASIDVLYYDDLADPELSAHLYINQKKCGDLTSAIKPLFVFSSDFPEEKLESYLYFLKTTHNYTLKSVSLKRIARASPSWQHPLRRTLITFLFHDLLPTPVFQRQ